MLDWILTAAVFVAGAWLGVAVGKVLGREAEKAESRRRHPLV